MTIQEAIKKYCEACPSSGGFFVLTDECGYWNINVHFIKQEKEDDQVQFDVLPAYFCHITGKCKKLVDMWKDFCRENGYRQNSVTGIRIAGGWM